MSNSLDYSDLKHIKQLAVPVMRPGDALIKCTGKPLTRVHFPYTDERHVQQFAGIIEPIIFKSSNDSDGFSPEIVISNGASIHSNISSPTPLVSPPDVHDSMHIFHSNAGKTIKIEAADYQQILQAGRAQLQENLARGYRGVHRARLAATLIATGITKNQLNSKIKCVADEQGWEYYSEAEISESERQTLLAGAQCAVCGSTQDLTIDHVKPKSKGGDKADGLQVLCRRHNSQKGVTT